MEEKIEEISIKHLIKKLKSFTNYLLSKWLLILIFGLGGGVLGLLASFLIKPKYVSHLTFIVESNESSSASGLLSLASSFGFGSSSSSGLFTSENIIDLLKSRKLVEKALLQKIPTENITFAEKFINIYEYRDDWQDYPGLMKINFKPNENREKFSVQKDSILFLVYTDFLEIGLNIAKINDESTIIAMDVKTLDEKFSKYFPEFLLKETSSYYIECTTKKTKSNVDALQHQTDSVRNELNLAITGVAVSNDQVFALNPSMNVARVPSAKKQVDVQANSAILIELVKNLELTKMTLLNETPLIEIIDRPIFPLDIKELKPILGIIIGGFVAGFLCIFFLLFKKIAKSIIN